MECVRCNKITEASVIYEYKAVRFSYCHNRASDHIVIYSTGFSRQGEGWYCSTKCYIGAIMGGEE